MIISKRVVILLLIMLMIPGVIGVIMIHPVRGQKRMSKQLEMGQHYLEELDYEQAIVSFNIALEIDPMSVEAYLGIIEVYLRMGNFDKAMEYAKKGYEITGEECLKEKIDMLESDRIVDSRGKVLKIEFYDGEGGLLAWHWYTYDKEGNVLKVVAYDADDREVNYVDYVYDAEGREIVCSSNSVVGDLIRYEREYDNTGRVIVDKSYWPNGDCDICEYTYNDNNVTKREIISYSSNGSVRNRRYILDEYDDNKNIIKQDTYDEIENEWFHSWETIMECNEKGQTIQECSWYDPDNQRGEKTKEITKYEYNERGELVALRIYNEEGKMMNEILY